MHSWDWMWRPGEGEWVSDPQGCPGAAELLPAVLFVSQALHELQRAELRHREEITG